MIQNFLYFGISAAVLILSATYLVKSLSIISRFLKISEFTAAFIIMAFATCLPELFIGISSAIKNVPELSLGNVIGASILDMTLIMGIIILVGGKIKFKTQQLGNDIYFLPISILILLFLYLIGKSISRLDGIILLILFFLLSYRMFRKKEKYNKKLKNNEITKHKIIISTIMFTLAIIILFIASKYLVKYSTLVAIDLKMPNVLVGIFLLSIATVLPELIFGIRAAELNHKEMAVGNQTGTTFIHILLIIGLVAIISPINPEPVSFLISAIFLLVFTLVFIFFLETGREFSKKEGVMLVLIYIVFMIIEFMLKQG